MNLSEVAIVTSLLGSISGIFIYLIRGEIRSDVSRLDGRINAHERECDERQKRLDERHDAITSSLQHINGKLDRLIEHRL